MNEVKQKLESVEQKQKCFKQQQFTFVTAMERVRESARHRAEPVTSVTQVQGYLTNHCNNTTDKRIISLFLEIMADLMDAFQVVESSASALNHTSEALDSCRKILSPDYDISQLRAVYPHDVVNRLSCDEARNYYGGVVSVIPVALDQLKQAIISTKKARTSALAVMNNTKGLDQPTAASATGTSLENVTRRSASGIQFGKAVSNCASDQKPAWRPPGRNMI